jgi:thiamine-phosphate pyrophosphorylase
MLKVPEIQYITRDHELLSHAEQARLAFDSGIKWVQLRMKNSSSGEIIKQAEKALSYANACGGKLIINDSADIARDIKAHGLHLGLKDMPVDEARSLLGADFIIGGTANTVEEVVHQAKKGADYVGLGPFRYTTTKKNLSPVLGMHSYHHIIEELKLRNISIPIVAVGGITPDDIPAILDAGMVGVAISGALLNQLTGCE